MNSPQLPPGMSNEEATLIAALRVEYWLGRFEEKIGSGHFTKENYDEIEKRVHEDFHNLKLMEHYKEKVSLLRG